MGFAKEVIAINHRGGLISPLYARGIGMFGLFKKRTPQRITHITIPEDERDAIAKYARENGYIVAACEDDDGDVISKPSPYLIEPEICRCAVQTPFQDRCNAHKAALVNLMAHKGIRIQVTK